MKSWDRDERTHVDIVRMFADLANLPPDEAALVTRELERYMRVRLQKGFWLPPEITRFHTEWYRELYRTVGVSDPYESLKRRSTEFARELIGAITLRDFREAVLASIVANRLDYGLVARRDGGIPVGAGDFEHIGTLELLFDDFEELRLRIERARSVLYLADNSGEILFDCAVIERIRELNPTADVYLAGKARPMLNDVTFEEIASLTLPVGCRAISTGSNCFGVPEDEVSQQFKGILRQADVVIAKGQAYLEFWTEYTSENVFNLTHTKFPVIDACLGEIPSGVNLILWSGRYARGKRRYRFGSDE